MLSQQPSRPASTKPASIWQSNLGIPKKTSMIQGGKQRIHTTFSTSPLEIIEEFDVKTGVLVMRKTKQVGLLGGAGTWTLDVGEDVSVREPTGAIQPSASTPLPPLRKDTKTQFTWRIRNLVWAKDVYQVSCDGQKIVVRTANKKYFATIRVSDMERHGLSLEAGALDWDWGSNTLVIAYQKPAAILEFEEKERKERLAMENALDPKSGSGQPAAPDGPAECKQQ
ncbi:hypothetical protein HDU91_003053 [Kappamyces sp. JEL0680]|nr:hypothetical protein HDU91_003053 [Kappamyces sp. JEL0680]